MRLIDADELRKDIVKRGTQLSGCYSAGIARYMDRILAHVLAAFDNAPTVDAVPVVRCKDCFLYGECKAAEWYGENGNGYCSVGDRRRDDD